MKKITEGGMGLTIDLFGNPSPAGIKKGKLK
jgi:hypothetical protein